MRSLAKVLISGAAAFATHAAMAIQVALLLQHRAQWEAVCGDPALASAAVAESLRQQKPQKLAIFCKLFAMHSYIRLHRLLGGVRWILKFCPFVHARIRGVDGMAFNIDQRESLTKV